MLLPFPFLSTIYGFANSAHNDNVANFGIEQLVNNPKPTIVTPSIDTTLSIEIPVPKVSTFKSKAIAALPFVITAIGACIHITAILSYDLDEKSKLLMAGDIFWLSSAITGIFIKFSGH